MQDRYVEVTARVTDAQGHFVSDLRKDDFRIFEDGAQQTITNFGLVNIESPEQPEPMPAWRNVESDVRSNEKPFDGRLYVLVLDDIHVAPGLTVDVRRSARRLIEHYMAEGDMAAVVSTSGRSDPAQELTTSRRLLLAAVDKFMGVQGATDVPGGRSALADDVLSSLRTLTELLGGVRGRRKAVVYFSEGPSLCLGAAVASGMRAVLGQDAQAVVAAATRANVAIYSIDPRGLSVGMDRASQRTGVLHCDVEVPDFRSLPLSMSGLLITSSLAGVMPTAPGGSLIDLRKRLPGPPTLSREFHTGEELAFYAEVYDNRSGPHDDVVVTTVLAEDGREVYRQENSIQANRGESLDSPGGRGPIVVNDKMPLRDVAPGRYLLRVEAQSRLQPNRIVRREIPFSIVP